MYFEVHANWSYTSLLHMEIHDAINVRGTKEIILTLSYLLQLNYFCRDLALQLNNWLPLFLEISPFKK